MIKKEGPGWRLIRDSSRDNFSTLIGGESWAIELNQYEWENLVKVVIDLSDQYKAVNISYYTLDFSLGLFAKVRN